MDKDQAIFSTMHEGNTNKIVVGDDRSQSVVGSGIVPAEMVISVMYYVFQKFLAIFYQSIKLLFKPRTISPTYNGGFTSVTIHNNDIS